MCMNLPLTSHHHPAARIHVYCSTSCSPCCYHYLLLQAVTSLDDTIMCHTGYHSHLYVSPCICPGLVICLRAWICPSKANTSLWDAIHAYLHVVHPGVTLGYLGWCWMAWYMMRKQVYIFCLICVNLCMWTNIILICHAYIYFYVIL